MKNNFTERLNLTDKPTTTNDNVTTLRPVAEVTPDVPTFRVALKPLEGSVNEDLTVMNVKGRLSFAGPSIVFVDEQGFSVACFNSQDLLYVVLDEQ